MSDQESNDAQVPDAEAGVTTPAAGQPPRNTQAASAKVPADRDEAPPRKGSSAVAWLALVLVLALAGGAGWLLTQFQARDKVLDQREQALGQRVASLESKASQKQSNLDAVESRLQRELESGLGELSATAKSDTSGLAQSVSAIEAQLAEQREEMARFGANDRASWLLAEVEYLLRLANQRLIMAGDTAAAQALLGSADKVLRELDDVALHPVRAAVAADLAAVRAVPRVDVEGIYLRLAALGEQATQLVIFQLPEQEIQPRQAAAPDWQDRLRQGYEAALQKLSDYIIIRRRDVPMQSLMDPQWEGLVRQNLRMLLEQAQVALLSGNQTLYRESLERSQHWVAQFMESDEAAARAMTREIDQLADLQVAAALPDISRSAHALDEAMKQRLQQQGGGE